MEKVVGVVAGRRSGDKRSQFGVRLSKPSQLSRRGAPRGWEFMAEAAAAHEYLRGLSHPPCLLVSRGGDPSGLGRLVNELGWELSLR